MLTFHLIGSMNFNAEMFTARSSRIGAFYTPAGPWKSRAQNGRSNLTPRILTLVEPVALTQLHPHSLANLLTNHQHLLTFNILRFPRLI